MSVIFLQILRVYNSIKNGIGSKDAYVIFLIQVCEQAPMCILHNCFHMSELLLTEWKIFLHILTYYILSITIKRIERGENL